MRTVVMEIFNFQELSESAKRVAINSYKKMMDRDFMCESMMITEGMIEYAKDHGIVFNGKNNIGWDLSYSQGDYVSIHNASLNDEKMQEIIMNELSDDEKELFKFLLSNNILYIHNNINHHHHYGQEFNVELEAVDYNQNELSEIIMQNFIEKLQYVSENALEKYVINLIADLKKGGYEEIDFYYSDEHIEDVLTINSYEFTA